MSLVERRSTVVSLRTAWLLSAVIAGVLTTSLASIRHGPTPIPDFQLYASIARAWQLFGVGVPTVTWNSPAAVDHVPFYGPVFFSFSAAMLRWLGVTLLSFRLTSAVGAGIVIGAVAWLADDLSGVRDRWRWAVALVVLAPEVNRGLGTGVMHMLAIGLEILALAAFVRALRRPPRAGVLYATAAGFALAMAATTTPRSYLFIAAFFASGILLPLAGFPLRRETRWQYVAAGAAFCLPFLFWITLSHGTPVRWARYMAYIFTHEDTDVAILATSIRVYEFSWTPAITPLVALAGALLAARGLRRKGRASLDSTPAAAFALLTAFTTFVINVVVLNYTFANGDYTALPLFAVVVAMPLRVFGLPRRVLAVPVALVMAVDGGAFALNQLRAAATWDATDPTPINDFITSMVPPGSVVVGPESPYFFPVERSGSRYRTVEARSWADWARWVPIVEPESVWHAARAHETPPVDRFFIWLDGGDLPEGYSCVRGHVVGVFQPPPTHLNLLGPFAGDQTDRGYPPSVLYRLPPGCPSGYDPTRGH